MTPGEGAEGKWRNTREMEEPGGRWRIIGSDVGVVVAPRSNATIKS